MEKIDAIYAGVAFVAGWILERPAIVKKVIGFIIKKKA